MPSINLLLKRKITGAPRALINRGRKLLSAIAAKAWKIAWAILLSPLYARAVHAEIRLARLGCAESILKTLERAPVYLEFHARRLAQVQLERGKVKEPAGILMRVARLNPTPTTVRAANHAWSELTQTNLGWLAVATAPRVDRDPDFALVISSDGEDLFGDIFEQVRFRHRNFSLKFEDSSPVVAECVLDRLSTSLVQLLDVAPAAVIAAPTALTDYKCLVVARAIADWAGAAFIVRLPIADKRPESTELAQLSYAKFSSVIATAQVVTADSQLVKQLSSLDGQPA